MSKNYYIIPIFVPHEGCPHDCVFCNQDKITGVKKDSLRIVEDGRRVEINNSCSNDKEEVTAESVRKTVYEYLETINHNEATVEISFFGGTFTGIREEKQRELLEVAREFKEKGLIDKIRMSTRPDYINEYILSYLKEYKADIIELGVQSLNEEVLIKAGRGHDVKSVYEASKLIKEYGFTLGHQIMPGLPGDSFETDIETAKTSISMKPDICRLYPALTIKGTAMEIMYNRGDYVPYTLEEAVEVSKEMYKLYRDNSVNVIRIGLQPTETINDKNDVVAGPFHPAFRELVESSLMAELILETMKKEEKAELHINSKEISKLYANKKMYFNKLKENNKIINVVQDNNVERGRIILYLENKKVDIIY
ncbi:elongator complex protein 3 [uncultured Clostridium sp.]|uniref:elongator complex protein 3 n=1 Tax=uncultured Clostridium sp. TaxID=59620 RepID=UPI0025F3448B|nr:radical SAM protein [uncultured Clostridium sp.]